MQLLDKARTTEFLSREFLSWLWFKSETNEGIFELDDKSKAELWFDGKLKLQSESDHGVETITCEGDHLRMKEARFALTENKEIVQAAIRLSLGDNQWSFTLDSLWMNFKSFKAPKIIQDIDEDPDGLFYEKVFLIDQAVSAINNIFASFIKLRISEDWDKKELPALIKWIKGVGN